jgi:co-chaperonin GroES (HSP10)
MKEQSSTSNLPKHKPALEEKYKRQDVMFARYAGSRIKIEGGEVRLLNDDEILATIKSPEDLLHEF